MRYRIKSSFHNTEMTITVKDEIQPIQGDMLTALEYEAYDRDHKHHDYAARKLREVKAFQSTRPHGARHKNPHRDYGDRTFQSTRPHGARRIQRLDLM